jgi:hypothetical protein
MAKLKKSFASVIMNSSLVSGFMAAIAMVSEGG